ncbi:MAG: hypothetical protein JWN86_732 [Planctomycetota bacterium]|nr:hypothetical protein [Planctomycetota bacterium]
MLNSEPLATTPASKTLVARRHPEWREHQMRWRWLLDSLEGGERYRQAVYGFDRRGMPVRNLIRHKREYPEPREADAGGYGPGAPAGADQAFAATDDDYELRRARTPVPTFVAEKIGDHLDRVFAREVKREGPDALAAWWADVDGMGADIDCWLRDLAAPALLACGSLDVLFDHPVRPDGEAVLTQADVIRLGLGACVATIVLPENMLWWRLDAKGRYVECLVREYADPAATPASAPNAPSGVVETAAPAERYRHWTARDSALYDRDGRELARLPHRFNRVPIVRLLTRRKARCRNVGQSSYEGIAERQREYYNRDSELILSDTTQAHPLLQGPEDFVQADGTIPIGPSWLLPKKKSTHAGTTSYEGFDVVNFPKDGADSLRTNKQDLRDEVDRDAGTAKPAGMTGAGTVSQSGISKGFDNEVLNNKLAGVADVLAHAEKLLAEFALVVLGDGEPDPAGLDAVRVEYSKQFDLTDITDLGSYIGAILRTIVTPGAIRAPKITAAFLKDMIRQALPGRDDATYAAWDQEIDAGLAQEVEAAKAALAAGPANPTVPPTTQKPPGA